MPNYEEDTEWNDILREKGIIPEIKEEEIIQMVDQAIQDFHFKPLESRNLDELDELEDDDLEDSRIIQEYRYKRIQALQQAASKSKFGSVVQISKADYFKEVTEASKDVEVVVIIFW